MLSNKFLVILRAILAAKLFLFNYMLNRNWKFPSLTEILTPPKKEIDLLDFIYLSEQQGWGLGYKQQLDDSQHSKFIKLFRKAAIEGCIDLSGRRMRLSETANKIEPHVPIEATFWLNNKIDIYWLNQNKNKNIKSIQDVECYLENQSKNITCDEYFDLRINERMARRWLTTVASDHLKK